MKGIVAVITYNCNITCYNCRYGCGPHKRGLMNPGTFGRRVSEAYNQGYRDYLEIAGGEPLAHAGMVYKYLKRINALDMKKSIVTNGFWGGQDFYIDILRQLKAGGINEIILEYDSFHSVFIPIALVMEAIKMMLMCGIDVRVRARLEENSRMSYYDKITQELIKSIRRIYRDIRYEYITINEYKGLYGIDRSKYVKEIVL